MRPLLAASLLAVLLFASLSGCEVERAEDVANGPQTTPVRVEADETRATIQERLDQYTTVRLSTDLPLSESDRQVIDILIEVAELMDDVFWEQAYGDRSRLLERIADSRTRQFIRVNYGPWDRLRGNEAFLTNVGEKPLGANFYPTDVTREDIRAAAEADPAILDLYTIVRRDAAGELVAIPYHEAYAAQHTRAAELLRRAARTATHPGFSRYLELRAEALLSGDYRESDLAWLDMRGNSLDFIVGPIETYEDQLFGAKAAHEALILVKNRDWSERLDRYADLLPELQRGLPVPAAYRRELPGTDSHLAAYDVVYYAGDGNAGGKPIAVNLPNDEQVQTEKGTRRLQLENAMRAKFDHILVPIADELIVREQRQHITFDAFFENVMFHEVAHGLGVKTLVDGSGQTVRDALREHAAALEEGKADVLGLYMIRELSEQGELGEDHPLMDNYVTFLASIFRSIRFGSASAHGMANLIRFNYFREYGAFTRVEGRYRVNPERLGDAVDSLSERILRLQGDGDYDAVAEFVAQYGQIGTRLREDLERLGEAQIPVDVVFEQGRRVLDL